MSKLKRNPEHSAWWQKVIDAANRAPVLTWIGKEPSVPSGLNVDYETLELLVVAHAIDTMPQPPKPYLIATVTTAKRTHNPDYDSEALCQDPGCGHEYYRHFDTYDEMEPVGCKYCACYTFLETAPEEAGT